MYGPSTNDFVIILITLLVIGAGLGVLGVKGCEYISSKVEVRLK